MDFETFERRARHAFEEIPEVYLQGIDGLSLSREAPAHPELPGVYTLGECVTEEHLSDFGSPETTRSIIVLHWGAFRALAERSPDFDWEHEIWETLTHELRHHLESLAGDAALEGVDYAADETFKRFEGEPFDPWYYQHGDEVGPGVFQVERSWYVEQRYRPSDFAALDALEVPWDGQASYVPKPPAMGDVHFIHLVGLGPTNGSVELVLVRERTFWEQVKRLVRPTPTEILESEVDLAADDEPA